MSYAFIDLIGTEAYWDEKSSSHMSSIEDYIERVWENNIEDGTDYTPYVYTQSKSDIHVPESELSTCDDLKCRMDEGNDYLKSNFDSYDSTHSIILLDWPPSGVTGPYGLAYTGWAGTNFKTCIVHVERFDGGTTDIHEETLEKGTSLHEALHTFNAGHDDGGIYSDLDSTTMTPNNHSPDCFGSTLEPERRVDLLSTCARDIVRDFIDQEL